jgi:two-component system, NarL family, sensor histidine kinase EvgS
MLRNILIFFVCSCLFSASAFAETVSLRYFSLNAEVISAPNLTDVEWRWLGRKREINVGFYGPARSPLVNIAPDDEISGYIPDLSYLTMRSLGVRMNTFHFTTESEALNALNEGSIDLLFQPAGAPSPADLNSYTGVEVLPATPVIVNRLDDFKNKDLKSPTLTLSPAYTGPINVLMGVSQIRDSRAILPAREAYYLIQRNFADTLAITQASEQPFTAYRFLLRKNESLLAQVMAQALAHVAQEPAGQSLASRRDEDNVVRYFTSALPLTSSEQKWLKQHSEIRVASSSFIAPFFLMESDGEQRGVMPDLLSLIGVKTGLRFKFEEEDDSQKLKTRLQHDNIQMTGPMVWSETRNREFLLTRPFMYSPEVLITKTGFDEKNIKTVALVRGQDATEWFIKQRPDVEVTLVGNPSLAMHWVAEGKVDATINTLYSSRYFIEGLYPDTLQVSRSLPVPDAAITLAINRSEPELYAVMNKAIAALPPSAISRIVSRWQSMPAARFETWNLYQSEFYIVAAAAFLVLFSAGVWAFFLTREVKRTRKAKALLREEVLFRDRLINGPPRPVYVVDLNGTIIHANKAFTAFFTIEQRPLLEYNLYDTRHPLFHIWTKVIKQLESTAQVNEDEFDIRIGDAEHTVKHWMTAYKDNTDQVGGMICGWQDVTDYLRMQKELTQARTDAVLASDTKSRFLASMSHEIRTPLSAIVGLLELQAHEGRSDAELIRVAHASSLNLLELIGDVLDISRIESGKMTLNPDWCRISALLNPLVNTFNGLARQKGLLLTLELPPVEWEILADSHRLRQILSNLIGNAVKFTEQGSVHINVVLDTSDAQPRLAIDVVDTGPGITYEAQQRLFSPFEQGGHSTSGGSGLGLAISREIAQLMGGDVTLRSMPGKGTTLSVTIPVNVRSPSLTEASATEHPLETLSSLNILIVDDHPANRLLIARQLSLMGHSVAEANNGQQGLAQWRSEQPDVIITDCSMPVMDGVEMSRRIREENGEVVIIGMTANAQESERQRCLAAGMSDCLFRPVSLQDLASVLATLTNADQPEDEALDYWLNLEKVAAFLPDSPKEISQFILTVITETRQDIQQAKKAIISDDYAVAQRYFHRMAGTLRVIGVERITDICELLEELTVMHEEKNILLAHLRTAEQHLEKFSQAFLSSKAHRP